PSSDVRLPLLWRSRWQSPTGAIRCGAGSLKVEHNDMKRRARRSIAFAAVTILFFVISHLLLWSVVSTGPNLYLSFGWLELHRYGDTWSVEQFHFGVLWGVVFLCALLTWMLSRAVRRRMT